MAEVALTNAANDVTTLSAQIVTMKAASAPADEIKAVVASLLKAKQAYADLNGGIGLDGKPFVANPTSADKKKAGKEEKKKEEKTTEGTPAAAAAPGGGNQMTPENAAKLAAKKAEKKTKKAEGGGGGE